MATDLPKEGATGVEIKNTLATELGRIQRENIEHLLYLQKIEKPFMGDQTPRIAIGNYFGRGGSYFTFFNPEVAPEAGAGHSEVLFLEKTEREGTAAETLRNYLANVRAVHRALLDAISACQSFEELKVIYDEFDDWHWRYITEFNDKDPMRGYFFGWNSNPPETSRRIYGLAMVKLLLDKIGEVPPGDLDISLIERTLQQSPYYPTDPEDRKSREVAEREKKMMPAIDKILTEIFETSPAYFVKIFTSDRYGGLANLLRKALPNMDSDKVLITLLHKLYIKITGKTSAPITNDHTIDSTVDQAVAATREQFDGGSNQ